MTTDDFQQAVLGKLDRIIEMLTPNAAAPIAFKDEQLFVDPMKYQEKATRDLEERRKYKSDDNPQDEP